MADLIAIGYPDEATAEEAADEARRLAADLAAGSLLLGQMPGSPPSAGALLIGRSGPRGTC